MKIAKILPAAAVAALIATPAAAGTINKGEYHLLGFNLSPLTSWGKATNLENAQADFNFISDVVPAWHAYGQSHGNVGETSTSESATFTLKGRVTKDCAFYTGSGNQTLDFGTIGIYATDSAGPAAAFDMVEDAEVTIYSNLAGCNSANSISLSKNDVRGLVNNSGDGYDSNVFQANLQYSVDATYTASPYGQAVAGAPQTLSLGTGDSYNFRNHGAWKSPIAIAVKIPAPSKSLLAGAYEGALTVKIEAF